MEFKNIACVVSGITLYLEKVPALSVLDAPQTLATVEMDY